MTHINRRATRFKISARSKRLGKDRQDCNFVTSDSRRYGFFFDLPRGNRNVRKSRAAVRGEKKRFTC